MTELQFYTPPASNAVAVREQSGMERAADFTTWATRLKAAAAIATEIAGTEFVPSALRGKIPAVTAAILAGSEMNLGPMASLMHVHVIEGRPALSAEMARSLVYAQGHQIRWIESTTQRCIVEGLRTGDRDWMRVEYTIQDAERAGLAGRPNWRKFPRRMLAARASGELCRLHFADCMAGMPYVQEELEDGGTDDAALPAAGDTGEAPKRTAKRNTTTRRTAARKTPSSTGSTAGAEDTGAAAPIGSPGPPLPGEAGYDTPPAEEPDAEPGEEAPLDPDGPTTTAMNKKMHALFREAECTEREDRLYLTGLLLDRQLDTSKGLTVRDGKAVIDALENLKAAGHPEGLAGAVNDLINAAEHARTEAEQQDQDGEDQAATDEAAAEQ